MGVILIYLQELEIAHDLSSEIIYEISKNNGFPDYLITGYIDELEEFHFASDLQISRCKLTFRENMLGKGRDCIFLGALQYLSSFTDKCKLLLLNKRVNQAIRNDIYKEILDDERKYHVNHTKLWWGYLQVGVSVLQYTLTPSRLHSTTGPNRSWRCR
jgi:hypothetical protein